MISVGKLYPQYRVLDDRRQNNLCVENDRRTGMDRRSPDRVRLHTELTKDIFEVKNKVATFQGDNVKAETAQKTEPTQITRIAEKIPFINNLSKNDNTLRDINKTNNNLSKEQSAEVMKIGILSGIFVGMVGALALNSVVIGIAGVGVGCYIGARIAKNIIVSHSKDK
ncbi:MAG: hypothetical protein PHV68_07325 [Candidatus Gastranaerophilales bacterium]|nr:hypothetical protein [Candidatus Gastranaerophilales bacterium]